MLYVATERISWIVIGLCSSPPARSLAWTLFATCRSASTSGCTRSTPRNARPAQLPAVQGWFGMASGGLLGTGLGPGPARPRALRAERLHRRGDRRGARASPACSRCSCSTAARRSAACAPPSASGTASASCSPPAWRSRSRCRCFVVVGGVTRLIPLTGLTDAVPRLRRLVAGRRTGSSWPCCCGSPTAPARPPESVGAGDRPRWPRWWPRERARCAGSPPSSRCCSSRCSAARPSSSSSARTRSTTGPATPGRSTSEYSRERGPIVVAASTVAGGVDARRRPLKYQRQLPDGPLYAPSPGYYAAVFGSATGIEAADERRSSPGTADQLFYRADLRPAHRPQARRARRSS